ncbi:MAG: hypothetical protein ACOC1F_03105 [Myxococcota bacterium]
MLGSAHWKWLGETPNLEGDQPGADVGKRNLVNNFCVAVPSNEKRCSQCHAGYGYADDPQDSRAGRARARPRRPVRLHRLPGSAPHGNDNIDNHAMDIACQTCHIPAFSRQQPTKMNWDRRPPATWIAAPTASKSIPLPTGPR